MTKDLPHEDIMYLESDLNYTFIHYQDGTRKHHGYTLKVFQEKLPDASFRRIHRKYLVNSEFIKRNFENSVLMQSGVELPVSRRKR